MSDNVDTQKRNLRPFTRRGRATDDPVVPNGLTVVSLWDPAVPEGLNEGDDYWNDGQILILTGEMANQQREVTGFVQATGTLTVAPRFVNPVATLLTVNSPAGDLVVEVADATGFTAGSLLTADAALGALVVNVVDASIFRVGNAVIWDNTPASEMVVITNVNTIFNQLTIIAPGIVLAAGYLVANAAVISMQSDAYIWDTAGAEAVTILGVDEVLNQLTIAPPGIVAALGYNVVDDAAISRSPAILDDVEFTLMPPTRTVDTGEHTNPEKYIHDNAFRSVVIDRAGAVATPLYTVATDPVGTVGLTVDIWWIYFHNHSGGPATVWLEAPLGTQISGTVQLANDQSVMLGVKPLPVVDEDILVNASANDVQATIGGVEAAP